LNARANAAEPPIELRSVTVTFGDLVAVDSLDLTVETGRTTVLIGPSGCGKSTVLKLIVGLLNPAAGEVRFMGAPVGPATHTSMRRRIGYVIQEGGLFPHLTARANATLMARHLRRPAAETAARLQYLRDLTHFPADALDRFPTELSGGQRQRVSLMRALMLEPEVLLLDEPLGALDPMVRGALQDELREIFASLGTTVLLVTHDLVEAAYLADTIVLMRAGKAIQSGALEDLTRRPAEPFVADFVRAQRRPVTI